MYDDYKVSDDLKSMMNNERIVWSGRPKKSCFVLECIFNPMLIFAFIWFMFDFMFISQIFSSDLSELDSSVWMFVGFFALHLMPVWIYLGGVIFSFRKLKNTEYAITDTVQTAVFPNSIILSLSQTFRMCIFTEVFLTSGSE